MAILITEACINCGECERECPNTAIYAPGVEWAFSEGTNLTGVLDLGEDEDDKVSVPSDEKQEAISEKFFYIVPDKCTECIGFHEEPSCQAVCPVDCCIPDIEIPETDEELLEKAKWLHVDPELNMTYTRDLSESYYDEVRDLIAELEDE